MCCGKQRKKNSVKQAKGIIGDRHREKKKKIPLNKIILVARSNLTGRLARESVGSCIASLNGKITFEMGNMC